MESLFLKFAVFLLVDESGSMWWEDRYKYARLAAVGLSSQVAERSESSINLSNDEAIYFARRMEMTMMEFETVEFRNLYKEVEAIMEEIYSKKAA